MKQQDTISSFTVERLKAGDEASFKIVYQQFSRRIYGNLLKLVKSENIARELLQDVFLKLWEKREQIDTEKSLKAYLFKIAENRVYDFFRKAARDKKLQDRLIAESEQTYRHVEEVLINREYDALIQQAIEALPLRRRQVFRLCKLEGKSYEETASLLGLTTSTVNDHIVKASRFIRKYCYARLDTPLTVSMGGLFIILHFLLLVS